jgi:hypothetical protein
MIYIIDIDNTICKTYGSVYEKSEPYLDKIKKINSLYDAGHTVIYWTARGSSSGLDWSELTKSQLDSWGCKYHELRLGKPSYDIWVDDKAINEKDFFLL